MDNQNEIDKIVKKNSAKYLKKLEEKDKELNIYREALQNLEQSVNMESKPLQKQLSNDDEIIKTVESILEKPQKERSEEECKLLSELEEKYGNALFNKDIAEVREWAKDNFDGDIDEILNNDEFLEFASDINAKLPHIIKKYIKITSKQDDKKNKIKTPGSVKDTSPTNEKHYFSKEEVEKMTPSDIKKYMAVIEKSIPKWSK